jgi:hypothetical protein
MYMLFHGNNTHIGNLRLKNKTYLLGEHLVMLPYN